MRTVSVHLQCRSPYLTPWRSCTVWGRLTWSIASGAVRGWTIGEWIQFYREGLPPLIIGDGIPFDAIPVPAMYLATEAGQGKLAKTLPWSEWKALCKTGAFPKTDSGRASGCEVQRQHVSIDRARGTAIEGQLRTEKGFWPTKGIIMTALVDDALGEERFRRLIELLCAEGWGYGRNYGYGHIELDSIEALETPALTGHVAALGHCHPTDDLPRDGYWRWTGVPVRAHDPVTRRGPSERFTTMLEPGATFACNAPYLGRMVDAPLPENGDYVHYGLAPSWPVKPTEKAVGGVV